MQKCRKKVFNEDIQPRDWRSFCVSVSEVWVRDYSKKVRIYQYYIEETMYE